MQYERFVALRDKTLQNQPLNSKNPLFQSMFFRKILKVGQHIPFSTLPWCCVMWMLKVSQTTIPKAGLHLSYLK